MPQPRKQTLPSDKPDSDSLGVTNTLSTKHAQLHQIEEDSDTVDVTTIDALIAKHGVPDFLKVDVEGYEVEVFSGLTQPVPLLCFEDNLPVFRAETLTVIEQLVSIHPSYRFNAVSNDGNYTFAFDDWEPAEEVAEFVKSIERASYDIFATANA